MQEIMTVHKALAELKILDDRIVSGIDNLNVVVANKHNNAKIGGEPINVFADGAKSDYQSVNTLINRRIAIKRAVTLSNAATTVTIAGKEYTVAEAIDMKGVGLNYLKLLKDKLASQYAKAKKQADFENGERLESRADEYVKALYAGSEMKNMADEVERIRTSFMTAQGVEIIDPINVREEITRLENKINGFLADVDSELSVANAVTTITVTYDTK